MAGGTKRRRAAGWLRSLPAWCSSFQRAVRRRPVGGANRWMKFDPNGFWTPACERWGYPAWLRLLVGFIETVGGVSLCLPWCASYGAMGLGMVMVGAWMTRFHDGRMVDVA